MKSIADFFRSKSGLQMRMTMWVVGSVAVVAVLVVSVATGYGLVYFAAEHIDFDGKKVAISGSGNVATYAAEKATQLGAKVLTMSDSTGWIYDENGIDLDQIKEIKQARRATADTGMRLQRTRSF